MKKILYLIQLPPPLHGASLMNQAVVTSNIINSNLKPTIIAIQLSRKLNEINRFTFLKLGRIFLISQKILTALIFNKPDIIYFSLNIRGFAFYRDILFVFILKLFGSKKVFHLHGKGILENSKHWYYRKIYQFIFNHSSVICVSQLLADSEFIQLNLKNTSIYAIENGIATIPSEKLSSRKTSNTTTFLFLSNLTPSKGIYVLLAATLQLKKLGASLHLNIVGGDLHDSESQKIKDYISTHDLSHCITLHGALLGEQKYEQLRNADCLVHPTLNESFSLVILEAMQFGLPVISTFEGGIPLIVEDGHTGLLVKKNCVEELTQKMLYLLNHEAIRTQMGKLAQQRFLSKYTLRQFEKNMTDFFNTLMHTPQ